jgi:hypothetical protein
VSSPSPIIEEIPWWRRGREAPLTLLSPLPQDECVRRLTEAVDPWWKPLGDKAVFGKVTHEGAWLRRRTAYKNSLKQMMRLNFADEGGRTRIDCRFGVGALVVLIAVSWILCLAAGIAGYALTMNRAPDPTDPAALPLFLLPPMAAIAIVVVVLVSRASGKKDAAFLTEFVKTTLSAEPA